MKLVNNSHWQTSDLKKLCLAVVRKEGADEKRMHIDIVTTKVRDLRCKKDEDISKRGRLYHGRAWLNSYHVIMKVPPLKVTNNYPIYGEDGSYCGHAAEIRDVRFNPETFAQVLEHELEHTFGLMHKEMGDWWSKEVNYAKDFVVNPKQVKAKPVRNLRQERYEHAKSMLKRYETKAKRISSLLKRWAKKVKYYES